MEFIGLDGHFCRMDMFKILDKLEIDTGNMRIRQNPCWDEVFDDIRSFAN